MEKWEESVSLMLRREVLQELVGSNIANLWRKRDTESALVRSRLLQAQSDYHEVLICPEELVREIQDRHVVWQQEMATEATDKATGEEAAEFSAAELAEAVDFWFEILTRGKQPASEKEAYVLGGQPGAGKSTIVAGLLKENRQWVFINGDVFREMHPRCHELRAKFGTEYVNMTAKWSGMMTDTMLEKVAEAGYNLIIEGTLRTAEIPCRTAKKLREHGYRVHLAVMAVPKEISYLTTLLRYLLSRRFGMGRAVAKAHHDGVVAKIPQNLKELWQCNQFATISLYSRRGLLYRAEDTDSLCGRFQAELARPWTTEERNWLSAAVPALEDTLTKLLQETTIVGTDDADLQAIFQEVGDRLEENK